MTCRGSGSRSIAQRLEEGALSHTCMPAILASWNGTRERAGKWGMAGLERLYRTVCVVRLARSQTNSFRSLALSSSLCLSNLSERIRQLDRLRLLDKHHPDHFPSRLCPLLTSRHSSRTSPRSQWQEQQLRTGR